MADNRKLLLVHKTMDETTGSDEVDIVLTPQFYTMKKESLPVRYEFQAKRIASSVFEGMLEEGKSYEYFVFKQDDLWVFIAYSLEEIIDFLREKGLDPLLVHKLFFAQQFAQDYKKPYAISGKEALILIEDTVTLMPRAMLADEQFSSGSDAVSKPKKGVLMTGSHASFLSKRDAIVVGAIFVLLAVLYLVEGSRYDTPSGSISEEYSRLIEANPALESQYKRESILEKYQTIDDSEKKKRELVKSVGKLIFQGVELDSLRVDDKTVKAHLAIKEAKVRERVEKIAKKEGLQVSKSPGNYGILIEGKL